MRRSGDSYSRDTAKTEIRGGAVWSVLAPGSTSVSVAVRLMEEERKQENLLSKDSNGELLYCNTKYRELYIRAPELHLSFDF